MSCESHQFKALKAKDGTCRVIERDGGKKQGNNASGKAGQDWLIAGVLCCQRDEWIQGRLVSVSAIEKSC